MLCIQKCLLSSEWNCRVLSFCVCGGCVCIRLTSLQTNFKEPFSDGCVSLPGMKLARGDTA